MTDELETGQDWEAGELDIIVADYFAMLSHELAGRSFVKSRQNAAIIAQIARSRGSVEFKHQNISAVLDQLGMPWVAGYKPRKNYQSAIFDAIDRYLTLHPSVLEPQPNASEPPPATENIFVSPPALMAADEPIPARLRKLVRKFDPVERDHRNRSLGRAGELFVLEVERRQLAQIGRADLAKRVRWVATEDGDGAGYDVLSFNEAGRERLIEVKTTNGTAHTPFFLTNNERDQALERPDDWRIYRVHLFATGPRIFAIAPPLESAVRLSTETWRASLR
jgi:hypothetical protein